MTVRTPGMCGFTVMGVRWTERTHRRLVRRERALLMRATRLIACASLGTLLAASACACVAPEFAAYELSTLSGQGSAEGLSRFIDFTVSTDVTLARGECPSLAGAVATVNGASAVLEPGGYGGGGFSVPGTGSGTGCFAPRVRVNLDDGSADAEPVTELVISGEGGEIRFSSPGLLQETETVLSIRGGGTTFSPGDTIIVDHAPSGDLAREPVYGSLQRAIGDSGIILEPVLQEDGSVASTIPTSPAPASGPYFFSAAADYSAEVLECSGVASCSYFRNFANTDPFVIDVLP